MGLCHFLGYLFHESFRIYGYGFQQFFASPGFMGIVFYQNSFIGELFGIPGFMGMIFRNISGFMDIILRNFSGFMGGTFTI